VAPGIAGCCISSGSDAGDDVVSFVSRQPATLHSLNSYRSLPSVFIRSSQPITTFLLPATTMSAPPSPYFLHPSAIVSSPSLPTTSHIRPSTTPITSHQPTLFLSGSSPVTYSPNIEHSIPPVSSTAILTVLEDLQGQLRSVVDRLDRVERSPSTQSIPIHIHSRPPSSHSIRPAINRLTMDAAARSQINNSNLPVSHPSPLSSSLPTSYPVPSTSSQFYPPQRFNTIHPSSHPYPPSPFQPITTFHSSTSPFSTSTTIVQPHPLPSSLLINPPASLPLIVPPTIPAPALPTTTQWPNTITSEATHPTATIPPLPSNPYSSLPSVPPTPFTMTVNNLLPTFKGLAHERPVQFINEFEIRASALVGSNDLLLLQTVQQVLSDGALVWFSQLQKTPDRITSWSTFKLRFYERYHTSAKVQSLRTELRLLFQGDNESTLDYFEHLKTLMIEIDPECTDTWLKHKFIQKLRSDVRSRLDLDINSPIREIVRKAQNIESNIEQQKVDEQLKLVAYRDTNFTASHHITTLPDTSTHQSTSSTHRTTFNNNHSDNNRRVVSDTPSYNHPHRNALNSSPQSNNSPTSSNQFHTNKHLNNTSNYSHHTANTHNNRQFLHHNQSDSSNNNSSGRPISSISNSHPPSYTYTNTSPSPNPSPSSYNRSSDNNRNRYFCSHCQRHGHSWERCSANSNSVNYRPTLSPTNNSSSPRPPNHSSSISSIQSASRHTPSHSKNQLGR
jgi:hypothetical protein